MRNINFIMQLSLYSSKGGSKLSQSQTKQRIQLIKIDKKYSLLNPVSQRQVTVQLQNELDYLLTRKEKENDKKKRIKELEELYEKERENKINKINSKISRSGNNREQGLSQRLAQTKRSNEYFQKIKIKKQHQNEEQIEKMLKLRKNYNRTKLKSTSSRNSLSEEKNQRNARSFSRNLEQRGSDRDIDSAIQQIQSRIDHAKTKNQFYKKQIAEKAKGYSRNFEEIRDKIRSKSVIDETSCFQQYYHRATHILECKQKSRSFYEKQSERKRKIIDDKFKKCTQNLQYLDKQRERKYDELRSKFDKTTISKKWKNQKNIVYLQKFIENQKDLEQEKVSKAQVILKKHLENRLKNRALREQKDKILQTVKKVQP